MRFTHRPLVFALAVAAGHVSAAQDELVMLKWSPDGGFAREVRVVPGRFIEACGKLPAKLAVRWRFESGGPLDFNIHFHEGKEVRYPAGQASVAKATGTLDTPVDQDYCWMWTNKSSSEVSLKFWLQRP